MNPMTMMRALAVLRSLVALGAAALALAAGLEDGAAAAASPGGAPRVTAAGAAPRAAAARGGRLTRTIGACTLEAPAGYAGLLDDLAERAGEILPRLQHSLGVRPKAPYRIVLIPGGRVADPRLAALDRAVPSWASGFLIPSRRVGVIRMARANHYPFSDLASVLAHEVTHMLLHDAVGGDLPRWFSEAVATGEERAWGLRDVLVYSSSLLVGSLPRLAEMDRAFEASASQARTAYAGSFDFLSWARRRHGPEIVRNVLRAAADRPFPQAWHAATGETLRASEEGWRRGSLLLYRWVPALTGTTALWIAITALALFAAARRRARSQAILARWKEEGDDGRDLWV